MRAAIEHAGADRALLIAVRGEELRTSAEASVGGNEVVVQVWQHPTRDAVALPDSLILYSIRTRDAVILDDAMSHNQFSDDLYLVKNHVRSVLCLPLINQGKLIGILYLENNLVPNVFTRDRVSLLKMLASQAAISLENTGLYRDLADREAKIRRLVDANIIGIFVADLEGRSSRPMMRFSGSWDTTGRTSLGDACAGPTSVRRNGASATCAPRRS
jgi:GAF domain-containing protein